MIEIRSLLERKNLELVNLKTVLGENRAGHDRVSLFELVKEIENEIVTAENRLEEIKNIITY